MNKLLKTILLILITLVGASLPAFASYIPFNTSVNMNVGIGTSTPQGAFVVTNGNVGIGTWAPGFPLYVVGVIESSSLVASYALQSNGFNSSTYTSTGASVYPGQDNFYARNTATTDGSSSNYDFMVTNNNGNAQNAYISAISNTGGTTYTPTIVIGEQTTSNAYAERMRIDQNGNVGIGSTAPGQALDVNGTARMGGFTLTGNGAANGNVLVGNSIGVGTWMPASTLLAGGGTNYWLNNSGGNVGISTTYAVGIGTSFVGGTGEAALSVMNGNVGIGTWVPANLLDIKGQLNITDISNSGFYTIYYSQGIAGDNSDLTFNAGSNIDHAGYSFTTRNNAGNQINALEVDRNGNVGLGTVTPGGALTVMTGNVGIGTWKPLTALEVDGGAVGAFGLGGPDIAPAVFSSTNLAGNHTNYIVINNNDGAGNLSNGIAFDSVKTELWSIVNDYENNGSQNLAILDIPVSSATPVMLIDALGNVGIGTVTPGQKLDVQGTIRTTGLTLTGNGAASGNVLVGNSVGVGTWMPASTLLAGGGTNYWLNNSGGNVGINTSYAVGIGTTFVGGTGEASFAVMNGNVGIGTWAPSDTLEVSGAAGGSIGILSPEFSASVLTFGYPGQFRGRVQYSNDATDDLALISSGIITFSVNDAGSTAMTLDTEGNLGIGTATPVGGLAVMNGNVGIGTWVPNSAVAIISSTATGITINNINKGTNTSAFEQNTDGQTYLLADWNISTNASANISTPSYEMGLQNINDQIIFARASAGSSTFSNLMTILGTGNVGIGTITPVSRLNINGGVGIGTTAIGGGSAYLNGNSAPSGGLIVQNNVGIGSTAPGQTLDVNGTARMGGFTLTGNGAANGNVLVGNSVGVGTWMPASTLLAGGGTNYWLINGGAGNVGINTSYAVGIGTSFVGGTAEAALSVMNGNVGIGTWVPQTLLQLKGSSQNFYINNIGDVGIGSISPQDSLDVVGNIDSSDFVNAQGISIGGNDGVEFGGSTSIEQIAGTLTAPYKIQFETGGGAYGMTFWNDNSLGIGTTSPTGALEVEGGNVGIGTWAPGVLLDVKGTARMTGFALTGNGAASGNVMVTNGVGVGTWMPASTLLAGGGTNYWLNNSGGNVGISTTYAVGIGTTFVGGTGEAVLSVMNGNVGIGTWVPRAQLDVEGTLSVASFAGNVGIGTQVTFAPLTVEGTISSEVPQATANFKAFSYNGANEPGVYIQTGNTASDTEPNFWLTDPFSNNSHQVATELGISTDATLGDSNQNDLFLQMVTTKSAVLIASESQNGDVVGFGWPIEFTTINDNLGNNMALYIGNTVAQNIGIGTTNPQGGLVVMNGNVGIGTWVPGSMLDVNGTARMTGFTLTGNGAAAGNVLVSNTIGVGTWMPTTTLPVGTLTSGTTNQVAYYSGALTLSSNSAMVFNAPNVGLGTVTPLATLQVVGNIGIGTVKNGDKFITTAPPNGGFIAEGNVGVGSWAPGQKLDVQGTMRDIGELVNGNVGIGTTFINGPGEAALSIMNGSVGIGTWVPGTVAPFGFGPFPGASLDVESANSNAGSFAVLVNNSNGDGIAAFDSLGDAAGLANGNGSGFAVSGFDSAGDVGGIAVSGSGIDAALYGQGVTYGLYVQGSMNYLQGNVGIGTLTPTNQLVVNGAVGIGTANSSYVTTLAPAGGMIVQGNVGIGSLHPGQVLDIQGTVRDLGVLVNGNVGIGTSFVNGAGEGAVSVMNGNIGIGTWVPAGQLDVEGTLSVAIFHGNVGIGTATVPAFNLDLVNGTARERNVRRVNTVASSATPTINTNTTDLFTITALAANITSFTTNLSGTPNNGDLLEIRILDNGTARTIAWGASFASTTTTLPLTTVAGIWLRILFEYNSTTSLWECVAST